MFVTISHRILLRMINLSNRNCRGNQNTHFMFSNFFQKCAIYRIMSKNVVKPERPQMTMWQHIACGVSKAKCAEAHACTHVPSLTHTHTQEYVIHTALPWQQWFCKRTFLLHCTYIACLVALRQYWQAFALINLLLGFLCQNSWISVS